MPTESTNPAEFQPTHTVRIYRREIVEYEVPAASFEEAVRRVQNGTRAELNEKFNAHVCEAEEYVCDDDGDPVEIDD